MSLATGEHATPGEIEEEDLDADHDDAPLRVRTIDDVIRNAKAPGFTHRALSAKLNFTTAEESATFTKAEKDAAWRATMCEEMKAIERNNTWELAPLPVDHRTIGLKWVYKVKRNEAGDVVRHKARLLAKGYV
jgi:hypothetical protein